MSIIYYPNRIFKRGDKVPSIDRVMSKRLPQEVHGGANVSSNALSVVISCDTDWMLDSVSLQFSSNAISKNYSVSVLNGIRVVADYNDYLWFAISGAPLGASIPQKITLSTGFYTGTQLASELETQLNANTAFIALGTTFTVSYTAVTGVFLITPSVGQIRYFSVNTSQTLRTRDSIAGHLFGLTATTAWAGSITSDTAIFGLDSSSYLVNETASLDPDYIGTDVKTFSLDQAIALQTNVAPLDVSYIVVYEKLV